MSGRLTKRGGAGESSASGDQGSDSLTPNERILRDVHQLYVEPDQGLIAIGGSLDLDLLAPRKRITVLLIGNHSAGKSSFINWYIEEHILRTGVAIETQGFSFVTSGRKRETLQGNATLHLYPYFKQLKEMPGVIENLSTEVSTSRNKKFTLVNFLDTPGLTDGDMKYGFDVDNAILRLGSLADLVFVFFDPIGQALCKRTLNIVEELSKTRPERMKCYLSKADEAGPESDRQKVLVQIAQELCKRPALNKAGFEMPTIYVPGPNSKATRCVNEIEGVCKEIEKTINLTIQNTLDHLERDCCSIAKEIDSRLDKDSVVRAGNSRWWFRGSLLWVAALTPLLLWATVVADSAIPNANKTALIGEDYYKHAQNFYFKPANRIKENVFNDPQMLMIIVAACLFLFIVGLFIGRSRPTLQRKQMKDLNKKRQLVMEVIRPQRERYYDLYLKQCVSSKDI